MTRRPGDVDQSSEGDWSFNLKQHAETPNLTIELETAELKELSVAGAIQPMTMELSTMDVQFVAPGHTGHTVAEMGRITGESTSVIVDLGEDPPPPTAAPASPKPPTATLPSLVKTPPTQNLSNLLPVAPTGSVTSRSLAVSTPTRAESSVPPDEEDEERSGMLLVVVVYLLAACALGISIYLRFFS